MKSEALEKEVLTAKDVAGILPEMLYVIVLIQCQETLQSRRLKKNSCLKEWRACHTKKGYRYCFDLLRLPKHVCSFPFVNTSGR